MGSDLFDRINENTVSYKLLYTVSADTFFQTSINMGNSAYLYIGRQQDVIAHTLIRFETKPDSGILDSTIAKMFASRSLDGSSAPMTVRMIECRVPWDEYEIRWDTWDKVQNGFLGNEIGRFTLHPESDTILFSLPNDRVREWSESDQSNYGLMLTSDDADFIMELYSKNAPTDDTTQTVSHPYSTSYVTRNGETLQSSRLVTQDAVLVSRKVEPTAERMWIHNGLGLRTFIKVEVEGIPENATVNKALLILRPDTTLSFPDNKPFDFLVYPVTSETWELPNIPFDPSGVQTGRIEGDSAAVDITFFLQNWIFGSEKNFGLILSGNLETTNLTSRAFYTTTADSLFRPHIRLYYTLPPSSRY
ncbi:MAG TPA: hypothetical protein ENN03_04505 [bacterium]|nr:hypothetical protein [bacterium]